MGGVEGLELLGGPVGPRGFWDVSMVPEITGIIKSLGVTETEIYWQSALNSVRDLKLARLKES